MDEREITGKPTVEGPSEGLQEGDSPAVPMTVAPLGGPPGGASGDFSVGYGVQPPGIDPVTGVLNLFGFGEKFDVLCEERPERAALWYIDIRMFRSINPKYGFLAGNMVLTTVADSIKKHLSGDLPVTRLGGDRFAFISEGLDFDAADERFHELVEEVNGIIAKNGVTNRISLMGGIYYLRDNDYERHDYKQALDYVSIAHRNAQGNSHSTLVLFADEDLERDTRRIVIEQSIDQALAEGQIEVWYQPQVDYAYGEIVGAEALARWNHPDLGWISPSEFIPVLENCRKVHDLDLFVWEEACRSAGRWRSMSDGKPVPISVNVSRAEMFEPGLMNHFKELQRKYDLPDGCLHLEVTESAFVEEADRLYRVIEKMRDNDMVIEMDDFGSGLSSLNMLKDVPVDVVKLDMGFVRSGVNGERGGVVLGSVIRMLQGLDTPIIAEGVETLEQAEMLKNMGCHLMQGFHFSHPMPLQEFEGFINTNTTSEKADRRERAESHLEDLLSFDEDSSFLFNEAIGGTMFFFVRDNKSESILVNDKFYEECGLNRLAFGNRKIDPIKEIDEESRATLWRASAEAREFGSAMCIGKVKMTGRWFEGCMRYLGDSTRGMIFALNICRSGESVESSGLANQASQDFGWAMEMLGKIAPNGFVKCRLDENLTIEFASPELIADVGLNYDEFSQRFHNSLIEFVAVPDRAKVTGVVQAAIRTGDIVDCDVRVYHGLGGQLRASLTGRIASDITGNRFLYLLLVIKGEADDEPKEGEEILFDRVIPFDYHLGDDRLVIHATLPDGSVQDVEVENWLDKLDSLPDNIDPASAAKVLATVRDLSQHPLSGFTDLKCNLRGGEGLRWYHINYSCDTDGQGNTTVVRGFAQDANDEMGSAKWWRRQAEIDQLTGLLNRNAVEQKINLLMRRHGGGMMFMIDLDGFKRVNDELGHIVGDDLLREVGAALSEKFREGDALGRYGGDEFVALMPLPAVGDVHELARRRAEDIIDAIKRIEIPDGTHAACSVGVAIALNRESSFYELLEVADQALYDSKTAGKTTVTLQDM